MVVSLIKWLMVGQAAALSPSTAASLFDKLNSTKEACESEAQMHDVLYSMQQYCIPVTVTMDTKLISTSQP